ncbi:MAG: TetR family transcriptional regulator C-terminal domain-containing protein [Gammaproteobacteria bacterium]|nr:TetR family transcriptional regulator C-terminal domain-containing protein [Gammaproteobacteria bacterium]
MPPAERKRTRIQAENEHKIIIAALGIFSNFGPRGTTVDQIASAAGMSKANVLYYFRRKNDIYLAVLEHTLTSWLNPLTELRADGDPLIEIQRYVRTKLALSKTSPEASRLFANEILQGAPMIGPYLNNELKQLVDDKVKILRRWMKSGEIKTFEPIHLLFMIWSTTQHYADFATQITALEPVSTNKLYTDAETFLDQVLVAGLKGPNYSGSFPNNSD